LFLHSLQGQGGEFDLGSHDRSGRLALKR
jgi:hypothetical protein